jgi:hypothetical protein
VVKALVKAPKMVMPIKAALTKNLAANLAKNHLTKIKPKGLQAMILAILS